MLPLNDTTEFDDAHNLTQGRGMGTRFEALVRRWFLSTLNAFGSAATRDTGTAQDDVAVLGAGGLLARARWAARFAANTIRGVVPGARIPNLNVNKVTSGTFGVGQVPNLSAANFTRGTFDEVQVPRDAATPYITGLQFSSQDSGSGGNTRITAASARRAEPNLVLALTITRSDA